MATAPQVIAQSAPITRKSCLTSISETLYNIENNARDEHGRRLTPQRIGEEIDRSTNTIENAKYQRNLMEFDTICRILAKWPEHCQDIFALWESQVPAPETSIEKRRRLIRELAALEDEA